MANYNMKIKTNSTCPQRTTVIDLINKKNAAFKSVIGEEKLRGFYPIYVDTIENQNLYGLIQTVSAEDGRTMEEDQLLEILANKPNVELIAVNGNAIDAVLSVEETAQANIDHEYVSPELQKVMDEKIRDGIVTKDDMDARLAVMQANKVDEKLKIRVVKGYRLYNKSAHKPRCIYVDPFIGKVKENKEGIIAEGLRNGMSRMPTICEGEKSVGKNVYMETIAWLMGMPLYMIGFSRNMSPSAVYGEKSTDNSAAEKLNSQQMKDAAIAKLMVENNATFKDEKSKGKAIKAAADFEIQKARAASVNIVIDASELYDWLIDGGVMVFNEMNMAESNFFSSFSNPLTDGTGFLFIPGRGEVTVHKDCVLFGTQNADYEGVQQQNEATMSRFNTLYFKQPDNIKKQLITATQSELVKKGFSKENGFTYEMPAKYFDQAQKFYAQCMKAVHNGDISNAILNIRGFVRALTVVAESEGFCPLSRWIDVCVIDTCPTDEREALRNIKDMIITI